MAETGTVDIPALIDQRRVSSYQIFVAALCGITVLLDGFDTQVMGYLVPAIARAWQMEPHALTPALVSSLVGLMIGALGFGLLADRIGRKKVIILSTFLFGFFMLVTSTATSLQSLALWRFLTGLGLGGAMPNAIALTAEYSPTRSRATMVMMMFFGFSFGAAIAGFLAAAIVPRFGWQAVFYVGGILPLLYLPVQVIMLPESIRVLALRGNEGARIAALLARMDPRLIFSAATRFVIHEEHAAGLPVRHLFREGRAPSTALVWLVFFANLLTLFFLVSWLPTVIGKAGISPGTAVVASSLLQIGGCVGVLLYGPILDRLNPFMVLGVNYLLGAIFVPLIGASGSDVAFVMVTIFFSGICVIGGQNAMNAVTATLYPTYIRSTGVGWALGIGRIGAIIGPIIGGALLASQIPLQSIFFVGAASALCTAAGVFLLGRAQHRRSLAYSNA